MNKKGIGLGLAISKKIINQFGGDIKVRSELNEGSTFVFTMKLEDESQFFQNNIVLNMDSDSDEDIDIIDKGEATKKIDAMIKKSLASQINDYGTEIA